MKILVVGSGGREHALCIKLKEHANVICAPGNPGIERVAQCFDVKVDDIPGLVELSKNECVSLVVVGPELPLSLGIVDALEAEKIPVFGPSQRASLLEGSKAFAKEIMFAAKVPTAQYRELVCIQDAQNAIQSATRFPVVLKADGLAAGKGVVVAQTKEEALSSLSQLFSITETGKQTSKLIIEDFLEGVEVSFIIATDGERVIPFSTAHDYKRLLDNDKGPNTGGMGTVSPSPRISQARINELIETVITPTLSEMSARGIPFKGFLYAGLMVSPQGTVNVVEYNARMGDPECQVLLARCKGDLGGLLYALATKSDDMPSISFSDSASVCVVLASQGYPENPRKGDFITGLNLVDGMENVSVLHAGTIETAKGEILTSGGRVLNVLGVGKEVHEARINANKAADLIQFAGVQRRRDIGN